MTDFHQHESEMQTQQHIINSRPTVCAAVFAFQIRADGNCSLAKQLRAFVKYCDTLKYYLMTSRPARFASETETPTTQSCLVAPSSEQL